MGSGVTRLTLPWCLWQCRLPLMGVITGKRGFGALKAVTKG